MLPHKASDVIDTAVQIQIGHLPPSRTGTATDLIDASLLGLQLQPDNEVVLAAHLLRHRCCRLPLRAGPTAQRPVGIRAKVSRVSLLVIHL